MTNPQIEIDAITSIVEIGEDETYDLTVNHPDHTFLANDISVSNCSHATAYAIDSYICAYLLTHYESEWLTAYVESMSNNPDDRARAFGELRSMGYKIVPIDVNHATSGWTILEGKRFMPSFLSCKGIGQAAVDEIIENRPYESIEDFLYNDDGSWKHSKLNKRAIDALIKIGALESLDAVGEGKMFKNYRHMHEVIVENMDLIKKSSSKDALLGKKNFYELTRALSDTCEPWTRGELADFQIECFGSVDVSALFDPQVIARLEEKGIKPIDQFEEGEQEIAWFNVESSTIKKTKTGREYLTINAVGPSGKAKKVMVWNWKGGKPTPNTLAFAQLSKNDFGLSTTSYKLRFL